MSCSPFDLKDYFCQELANPQRLQVEAHVKTCRPCREELERLRLTEAAMLSLREEEIPQRIAFVSDQVFEPSPLRRWWEAFWGSSARLGFASAAMLSAALVFYAAERPKTIVERTVVQAPVKTASYAPTHAEIQQRIDRAVAAALPGAVEQAVTVRTKELVAQLDQTRKEMNWTDANFELWQKRDRVKYTQAMYRTAANQGDNNQ
jgi:anti-sigma factor RsiW